VKLRPRGEVYSLIYDRDDLRAPLLEDRGLRIAFGGMDEFTHALVNNKPVAETVGIVAAQTLPASLVSTIEIVEHSRGRDSDLPARMARVRGGRSACPDRRRVG
jgi:hypothetical protein